MLTMSYKEAANLLGVPETRIRNAVSRNHLTQVPSDRRSKKELYREQVELFKGKPYVSLNALSREELDVWERAKNVEQPQKHSTEGNLYLDPVVTREVLTSMFNDGREFALTRRYL